MKSDLILQNLSAFEPPRENNDPLGRDSFGHADGFPRGQQRLSVPVVMLLAFIPDDGLPNQKLVLESILR